ncbi:DNA polymerase III subunit alpha [Desulfoscipio gibsoniae]|uniref:DNA-directed DNA polymerase n=1 Tax=Desulfoscipio gibsoniae DSM 7213 TaxID=767817 RepID=R4KLR3_9FIRM|nr:DNA polymerase III subunit alpha [Desulfoscipio gibsoniae]AGL00566.1 DNA-directed DNA polymerase III PolC [Desulfoscipio gibsoniae DSM 7213]
MTFVHLHTHSEYSFLDGACRLGELVSRAGEFSMPALALTDHGGLHGAIEFYQLARQAGIKPIIGCEVYLAPDFHLVLLAKNHAGYENLVQLVSRSHLKGLEHKPKVDKNMLACHAGGLIALSGCLAGEIPRLLLHGKYAEARGKALEYQAIFSPGNFYLELQNHGLSREIRCNRLLTELARETKIPLVATNNVHYLDHKDASIHELLVCIGNLQTVPAPNPLKPTNAEFYLKSAREMRRLFRETPQAIENTIKISAECNLELPLGSLCLPFFPLPEGVTYGDYLAFLCQQGLNRRYANLTREIRQRLERELKIIGEMKLAPYFLIVADLVAFAREKKIPVGPGRGSAGGSLVAYALGITSIDPIENQLFFERFLNPERPDLPDIDLDLCQRRRDEVFSYIHQKYGAGHVAQIGIFSTLGARGAVRDVGKALGVPQRMIDLVVTNLPHFSGKGGLEHALATLPEFKTIPVHEEPWQTLIEKAGSMEGRVRHRSVHPAGVVISRESLNKTVPLQLASGGEIVTQYGPESLEALGLLKIDLLGLRNLTIIDDTLKLVAHTRGVQLTPEQIPPGDPAAYRLLQNGETLGCFQLESSGMRSLLKKLKPTNIRDLIALLALYRPGPWDSGMVERFLKRRRGEEPVVYPHSSLEPVLTDTYGIVLFQEQVMQVANVAAGYRMGEADLLRRAVAKKSTALKGHESKFIRGCLNNGFGEGEARKIFAFLTRFAGYSFNKAHSTAYACICYQTAFLKANYPEEYFASLLSSQTGYYNLSVYVEEAKRRGIKILPPEINRSSACFTVDQGAVRVGLAIIKGVGYKSVREILKARKQGGEFTSFYDFCFRVDTRVVNRRVLKNLINSGSFDSPGLTRPQLLANTERVLRAVRAAQKTRKAGQLSLMDLGLIAEDCGIDYELDVPDYSREEKRRLERELLSISIMEHPFARYQRLMNRDKVTRSGQLTGLRTGNRVTVAGTVVSCRRQPTRNKDYMLILLLEDPFGQVEVILFPGTYQKYLYELNPEGILVRGKICFEGEQPKVIAESIRSLANLSKPGLVNDSLV